MRYKIIVNVRCESQRLEEEPLWVTAIRLSVSVFALTLFSCFAQAFALDNLLAPAAVEQFHADRNTTPIWNERNLSALVTAIEGLRDHGLNSEHYHLSALRALSSDPERRDRLATDAWFSAAAHMVYGKLDPLSVEADWTAAKREADLAGVLNDALDRAAISESLYELAPKQVEYQALKDELATLRTQAAISVTQVPDGPTLRKGDEGPRVEALRARLIELRFLDFDASEIGALGTGFSEVVEDAVIRFQADTELDEDGIVGTATIKALNRGLQGKIDQVRVNLERWRWLPEDLGQRHIRANIAGFSLTVWENGQQLRTHLMIVGKPYRKTPVFSGVIQYVVFNPWWEIPDSIARRDKLPAFRKDPPSVNQLGFQVLDRSGQLIDPETIDWDQVNAANFPYRLRQAPGPQNALGQVKIMFPNRHNVYIHDSPLQGLFAQRQRAFSSGCLRTHEALDLVAWLLSDAPQWGRSQIDNVVANGKEMRVDLASPVQVHILYFTAVAEPTGGVRYLDDIYGRDGRVLAGLIGTPF
jgi:murein L,D-transpeptidase YcbB/YkuD